MAAAPRALVVCFGLPGAGKSFVARRLASRHAFTMHDGDDDLPPDMRAAIDAAAPVTEDMRDRFNAALLRHVEALSSRHPRLVVAQTFLKARHRAAFRARFPEVRFVLVEAPEATRVGRLAARRGQPLEPRYAQAMTAMFDAPEPEVARVWNGGTLQTLDAQLAQLAY